MLTDTKENRLMVLSEFAHEAFKNKDYVRAIIYYQRYSEIDPDDAAAYNTLGYLYQKLSKYENIELQISLFEKAVKLRPDYIQAIRNLALAYPLVDRYDDSIECFHKLFKLGAVADDYMAYGCLMIRLKDFKEGWKNYEYRFLKEIAPTEYPKIDKPKWDGSPILESVLLVHYEQGFGDTIQFCRYLEQVKPLVKKIIFRVQSSLVDFMQQNLPGVEVVGLSASISSLDFDYHIPIMSLMYVLDTRADNIPYSSGYLHADSIKVESYKNEYFNNDMIKIGISWNGAKFGNVHRDIPLEHFYPLANIKNAQLYSFQKDYGVEQLENIPDEIEIVNLGKTFKDFSDTAAAMANLDLFVTSDNVLFNLAGAMGNKTYALLNKHSEWRWFTDEEKTPWYESVKLFKKKNEIESWDIPMLNVINQIETGLKKRT